MGNIPVEPKRKRREKLWKTLIAFFRLWASCALIFSSFRTFSSNPLVFEPRSYCHVNANNAVANMRRNLIYKDGPDQLKQELQKQVEHSV
jgi:hypothetical protein